MFSHSHFFPHIIYTNVCVCVQMLCFKSLKVGIHGFYVYKNIMEIVITSVVYTMEICLVMKPTSTVGAEGPDNISDTCPMGIYQI